MECYFKSCLATGFVRVVLLYGKWKHNIDMEAKKRIQNAK